MGTAAGPVALQAAAGHPKFRRRSRRKRRARVKRVTLPGVAGASSRHVHRAPIPHTTEFCNLSTGPNRGKTEIDSHGSTHGATAGNVAIPDFLGDLEAGVIPSGRAGPKHPSLSYGRYRVGGIGGIAVADRRDQGVPDCGSIAEGDRYIRSRVKAAGGPRS